MLYSYYLEGFDSEWQSPTRSMRAFYRELPPGDYTFHIKAIDRDFNESKPATLGLQITPDARDQRISELEQRVQERTAELQQANAELQIRARAAQVETAIERVRSVALAMQTHQDLPTVSAAVFREIQALDFKALNTVIGIIAEQRDHISQWTVLPADLPIEDESLNELFAQVEVYDGIHVAHEPLVPSKFRQVHSFWNEVLGAFDQDAYPLHRSKRWTLAELFAESERLVELDLWTPELAERVRDWYPGDLDLSFFRCKQSYLSIHRQAPLEPGEIEELKRFADVFDFAYDRFLDLQEKERRARLSQIEAGLEGVRAEVAAMQQSTDIFKMVARVSQALRELEIPCLTFGFNLFDNDAKIWTAYFEHNLEQASQIDLTKALEFEYIHTLYTHWKAGQTWYRHTAKDEFEPLLRFYLQMGYLNDEIFHQTLNMFPQEGCWILDIPFHQGTLALISPTPLDQEQIALVERFTQSFALGYVRYLDFQRLESQNRALEAANADIQQATTRKSQFMASMSHDLRTPMNAIIGYTRILLRRTQDALEPRLFQNLEHIETSSNNLLALINEIMDLSRIESGHIELKPTDVDLAQLANECAVSVEPLVKDGVEFQRDLQKVPAIRTDREILRRVLINLLGNAVKFTEAGSITLSVYAAENGVEVSIADTGVGIPPEDLPHIFEEFRQVNREGAEAQGSGLGLAIVKKSVELLGGTIQVESKVSRGTAFTFRIGNYSTE